MKPVTQDDIDWSQKLFASLREGGMWGVPRSGLIFKRKGNRMILTGRMPFSEEIDKAARFGADVPPTAEALAQYQKSDFNVIAARFRAAGIEVEDETKLP